MGALIVIVAVAGFVWVMFRISESNDAVRDAEKAQRAAEWAQLRAEEDRNYALAGTTREAEEAKRAGIAEARRAEWATFCLTRLEEVRVTKSSLREGRPATDPHVQRDYEYALKRQGISRLKAFPHHTSGGQFDFLERGGPLSEVYAAKLQFSGDHHEALKATAATIDAVYLTVYPGESAMAALKRAYEEKGVMRSW